MKPLPSRLRRVLRCRRGVSAPTVALLALPLVFAVGLGVDGTHHYIAYNQLVAAADAAVLAMGSADASVDTSEKMTALGNVHLAANLTGNSTVSGAKLTASCVSNCAIIDATTTATINTAFLGVLGFPSFTVAVGNQVTRVSTGLEIALVLDVTGSMWTNDNIGALRNAALLFVNAVYRERQINPNIVTSIVPYSAAVNLGDLAPKLVDKFATGYRPLVSETGKTEDWKGCVLERAGAWEMSDEPPGVGRWYTPYRWESADDNLWTPSTIDEDTKKLQNGVHGPNIGCPSPVLAMSTDRLALQNAINGLTAWNRGGTLGNIGLAWGNRMLSPRSTFLPTTPKPWTGNQKIVVVMTDGDNLVHELTGNAGVNKPRADTKSDYTAYGFIDEGRMGTTQDAKAAKKYIDERMANLCTTLKQNGVLIYSIIFGSGGGNLDLYKHCATDETKFFYAKGHDDLSAAFNAISVQVTNMRLSK